MLEKPFGTSKIVAPGASGRVRAVSIDTFCAENQVKVDYIKLDVEGSELEVLHGAAETMRRDRPQLAICLYHEPSHVYEIPLYLSGILSRYVWRIKHFRPTFQETVLYGIPENIFLSSE